jgi:hypothetical protein
MEFAKVYAVATLQHVVKVPAIILHSGVAS